MADLDFPEWNSAGGRRRTRRLAAATGWLLSCGGSLAAAQGTTSGPTEIDACGTLAQGAGCVVFEAAGGRYILSDYYGFRAGDFVRVVGTADPSCITICDDADGCVRGAVVYDATQLPCGTALPNLGADLCAGASAALLGSGVAGLIGCRPRRRR